MGEYLVLHAKNGVENDPENNSLHLNIVFNHFPSEKRNIEIDYVSNNECCNL